MAGSAVGEDARVPSRALVTAGALDTLDAGTLAAGLVTLRCLNAPGVTLTGWKGNSNARSSTGSYTAVTRPGIQNRHCNNGKVSITDDHLPAAVVVTAAASPERASPQPWPTVLNDNRTQTFLCKVTHTSAPGIVEAAYTRQPSHLTLSITLWDMLPTPILQQGNG